MNEDSGIVGAILSWLALQSTPLQAFASLVTALAAIVALILSIYVPYRLDSKARKRDAADRRVQARALAIGIFPDLLEIEHALKAVRQKSLMAAVGEVGRGGSATLESFRLQIPPMLDRSLDRLYLLGEPVGATIIQLISVIIQYNRLLEFGRKKIADDEELDLQKAIGKLDGHLTAIETLLYDAKTQLAPIHDG